MKQFPNSKDQNISIPSIHANSKSVKTGSSKNEQVNGGDSKNPIVMYSYMYMYMHISTTGETRVS